MSGYKIVTAYIKLALKFRRTSCDLIVSDQSCCAVLVAHATGEEALVLSHGDQHFKYRHLLVPLDH